MRLIPPVPEPVSFEEVAAVLDEAAIRARGGPPYAINAAGWTWPLPWTRQASAWSGRQHQARN